MLKLSMLSEVHIEVNSGTFSMAMLEQCINNPRFEMPRQQQPNADTFEIAKAV